MPLRTWKLALVLVASLQLAGSVELFRALFSDTPIIIPPPWRLLAVLAVQAAVTAMVARAWRWSHRERFYAVASLVVLSVVSIILARQETVAGRNINVERIRHQTEGLVVVVVLAGFAVLNGIFAVRRPHCSKNSVLPETGG